MMKTRTVEISGTCVSLSRGVLRRGADAHVCARHPGLAAEPQTQGTPL